MCHHTIKSTKKHTDPRDASLYIDNQLLFEEIKLFETGSTVCFYFTLYVLVNMKKGNCDKTAYKMLPNFLSQE
jgi:hypothetical protein